MTSIHRPEVELSHPIPPEVDAGSDFTLQLRVSCPSGCDLRGNKVQVLSPDGLVITSELATYDGGANETEAFSVRAPPQVTEHSWSIVVPEHQSAEVVHEECSLILPFATQPHAASMAIWDVPSPVVLGTPFRVKVGVKCSSACRMTGEVVEVRDEAGSTIGEGRLTDAPWPGTAALYVTDVDLTAPTAEGMISWSAGCTAEALELPHSGASAAFSLRVVTPPEHRVTVNVFAEDTETPLEHADVRLGIYRARTDERGLASLDVPKGRYDLNVLKIGYETPAETIVVSHDVAVKVEAAAAPDPESDDDRLWM